MADNLDKRYYIERNLFIGMVSIEEKDLTYNEAIKLCEHLNKNYSDYCTSYEIKEMKNGIN